MVSWIITLLISWLTGRGYYILKDEEYVLIQERIDSIEERIDTLSNNINEHYNDSASIKELVDEWLNGEAVM